MTYTQWFHASSSRRDGKPCQASFTALEELIIYIDNHHRLIAAAPNMKRKVMEDFDAALKVFSSDPKYGHCQKPILRVYAGKGTFEKYGLNRALAPTRR